MSNTSTISVTGWVIALALYASAAIAADEVNVGPAGVALHGYDPVSYFDPGRPVQGSKSLSAGHDGAVYFFSTRDNLRKFIREPGKYTPAYGGWCSYGVRVGRKFDADPNAWVIESGKLYLQLDLGTQKVWDKDRLKNIEIADRLWPSILSTPAEIRGK
ncbi:MAG: hypothetical protein JJ855_04125 [Rhodospirillales bacterium]|nr:hypothetical protein [Rhodospirillales bacterium]